MQLRAGSYCPSRRLRLAIVWLSLFSMASVIGLIYLYLPQSNFGLSNIISTQREQIYGAEAAIVATIVTISFSIFLLIIQQAASNYTPQILRQAIRDIRSWLVFSLLSSISLFDIVCLTFRLDGKSLETSIILTGYSFVLLALQLFHNSAILDPVTLINRITNQSLREIAEIKTNLDNLSDDSA